MAYLTRVSGKAFIEYFRRGQAWGAGGIDETVLHQFDQTSRAEFLQDFASQFVHKVLKKFHPGTSYGPCFIGPEGGAMKLFPDDHETIAGTPGGSVPARRRASRSYNRAWTASTSESTRSGPGCWWTGEGAMTQAVLLDVELQTGHDRSPLHGIPIGVKDIIDVKGLPTHAGSPAGRAIPRPATRPS